MIFLFVPEVSPLFLTTQVPYRYNMELKRRRRGLEPLRHKFAYSSMKNGSFASFAGNSLISVQLAVDLVLRTTCFAVTWTS